MAVTTPRRHWSRRRLALGLSPTPGPGLALLVVGMLIGPAGLGALSSTTLDALDPLVSLALASLGVFVGLDLQLRGRRERLLLAAGSLEGGMTIAVVAGGFAIASRLVPGLFEVGTAAVLFGICAASSSTVPDESETPDQTSRIGDLDDVLPIVIAGVMAVGMRSNGLETFATLLAQTAAMAALLAGAAVLLVRQTGAKGEQRVFTIGTVLLLGGVAANLSLSALAVGLFAGLCWNVIGGDGRERIVRDLRDLQHPLTVPLLIIAGARLRYAPVLIVFVLLYIALRTAGKLLGGYFSRRVAFGIEAPPLTGLHLTSPGAVGIAIALEALRRDPEPATATAFSAIVAAALMFDLLSFLISRTERVT